MKLLKKLFGIKPSGSKPASLESNILSIEKTFSRFSQHQQMVAIHEAGHVIGALYMGAGTPLRVQLDDEYGPEWSGRTKYDFTDQLKVYEHDQEFPTEKANIDAPDEAQTIAIARMRYGIAMAGPIAQARFQKVSYLHIRNLKSYQGGEDIKICQVVEDEIDRIGLDSFEFVQKIDKEINEVFHQPKVWHAIALIAQALLIAENHKLTKQQIDTILAPEQLFPLTP
ncbi:hypothetical protein [Pedobacter sp. KBW01]|uniref:hypothetical protein n=1 Tax=Pedobacter sp. KBW01 TaxID=2153364 RepID=UPI000F5B33EF|nr:hypothetical protein [Pedobacter sp. KBW01]